MLAPVLWFSPDEPLLSGQGALIPAPYPCDRASDRAVVYYQITDVHLLGNREATFPVEDDPELFKKARALVVRYFFYYPEDHGLSPHRHDLEAVDVELSLERQSSGCFDLRVRRVTGLAHGLEWYSNILEVERDTRFPIAVLVEEGKHASCPDRNADGQYTPGYDVTARVNDAWGVRDVMATGRLLSSGYRAELSKQRRPEHRLLPPDVPLTCASGQRSVLPGEPSLGQYELRPARGIRVCDSAPEAGSLARLTKVNRFGARHAPRQHRETEPQDLELGSPTGLLAGVGLRVDGGNLGGFVTLRGIDFGEGWIVPRFGLANGFSAEMLITRSASRWVDPYVSLGVELDALDPRILPDQPEERRSAFVSEVGFKFRVQVSGRARWLTLGSRFGGLRLGVRFNGLNDINYARWVLEVGPGVW
ncbi:MAG: hypothetical protein ACRD2X_28185 [Vicinamibacteraceae bacterium]